MKQLCDGMAYMASKRLVHMDFAERNCLLADDNLLKIGDFGLTKPYDDGGLSWVWQSKIEWVN